MDDIGTIEETLRTIPTTEPTSHGEAVRLLALATGRREAIEAQLADEFRESLYPTHHEYCLWRGRARAALVHARSVEQWASRHVQRFEKHEEAERNRERERSGKDERRETHERTLAAQREMQAIGIAAKAERVRISAEQNAHAEMKRRAWLLLRECLPVVPEDLRARILAELPPEWLAYADAQARGGDHAR